MRSKQQQHNIMYMKEEEEEGEEDNTMKYMKHDEGREDEATAVQYPQVESQHQYWADQIFSIIDKNMNCLVPYFVYSSVWHTF